MNVPDHMMYQLFEKLNQQPENLLSPGKREPSNINHFCGDVSKIDQRKRRYHMDILRGVKRAPVPIIERGPENKTNYNKISHDAFRSPVEKPVHSMMKPRQRLQELFNKKSASVPAHGGSYSNGQDLNPGPYAKRSILGGGNVRLPLGKRHGKLVNNNGPCAFKDITQMQEAIIIPRELLFGLDVPKAMSLTLKTRVGSTDCLPNFED